MEALCRSLPATSCTCDRCRRRRLLVRLAARTSDRGCRDDRGPVLSWEGWLSERPIAVIATVGEDGGPHAVPVEVVVRDGVVYCWCKATSVKARNAARTGRASLVAYKGHAFVHVRGRARLIREGEDGYEAITRAFLDKYEREETYGNDTVIEIAPERIASDRVE